MPPRLTAGTRTKMSIRVYQVDRYGTVTQDRGTVTSIRYGEDQLPAAGGFPPCACPRCRAARAAQAVTE